MVAVVVGVAVGVAVAVAVVVAVVVGVVVGVAVVVGVGVVVGVVVSIEVPRDRWERPLVQVPGKDKLVPYKRASSLGGLLEYSGGIEGWKMRLVAQGMAQNPHLALRVAAAGGNKAVLNGVAEAAFQAAGGSDKADIGTALHALTEQYDRGADIEFVPSLYEGDLDAYAIVTGTIKWLAIEQFVVCDELQVAGTPDRIGTVQEPVTFANGVTLPAGWTGVFDIKTGSVNYPHSFSVQLAVYAHSKAYDPATGERTDLPPLDQQHAVLIHLPAGEGECSLHLLDIAAGWGAARLALEVDSWRKHKNLTSDAIALESA